MIQTGFSVLNTGAGDIEVELTDKTEEEISAAVDMLESMQKRGYAILVDMGDGTFARAQEIDGKAQVYRIKIPYGEHHVVTEVSPTGEVMEATPYDQPAPRTTRPYNKKGKATVTLEKPITKSRAVAVARSAGG